MPTEIERKFLVKSDDYKTLSDTSLHIVQGYLSTSADATVRVRIIGDSRARLTVKGRSDSSGLVRSEWEYDIPVADAVEMLGCAGGRVIDKTRHIVTGPDGHKWEVDEFHGRHQGFVIAEVELSSPDEAVVMPTFVGEEVTGDVRYYNSHLSGLV